MPIVREFFRTEAEECLRNLEELLGAAATGAPDAPELLRVARLLRGSAQMARDEEVASVARALETVARGVVSDVVAWDEDLASCARSTVADLWALVGAQDPQPEREARAARAVRALGRWAQPGTPAAPAAPADRADEEFQDFAAREVASIGAEMDRSLPVLVREPRNREPLKAILRRQRALLGATRVDELPPVAEALRSIDRICRLIARQDVPVEGDWLDLFRTARRVLAESVEGLVAGTPPATTPSLETLRRIRDGLLGRYGVLQEPQRAQMPAGVEPPKNVGEFFRHEASVLIGRIERMAGDLERAAPDRQLVLRRELQGALAALRDTALGLGFGRSARMAETALARVGGATASEVLDLLPKLKETVESDQPVSVSAARGGAEEDGAAAGGAAPGAAPGPAENAGAADDAVPVATLVYRGPALLQRADELRPVLEQALAGNDDALQALEELYDLIRQGLL